MKILPVIKSEVRAWLSDRASAQREINELAAQYVALRSRRLRRTADRQPKPIRPLCQPCPTNQKEDFDPLRP